jgi:hypothetical protein
MENEKHSQLFISLVYTFQMQTLVSLGKLKNPMTEKTEKDLTAAQTTIDMLEMLKEKTKNNLTEQESKFLDQSLSDLRLNYIEEQSRSEEKKEEKKEEVSGDKKSESEKKEEVRGDKKSEGEKKEEVSGDKKSENEKKEEDTDDKKTADEQKKEKKGDENKSGDNKE